jgi:hypothetical protein
MLKVKHIVVLIVVMLLQNSVISTAISAPAYDLVWDYDDSTYQGWTIINNNQGEKISIRDEASNQLLDTSMLRLPSNGAAGSQPYAIFNLPEPTNRWILTARIRYSRKRPFDACGIGYINCENKENGWFEPDGSTLKFGDPSTSEWPGGAGVSVIDNPFYHDNCESLKHPPEILLRLMYNHNGQGKIETWFKSVNYSSLRGKGEWFPGKIASNLPKNPDTGEPYRTNRIRLGGAYSQADAYFDDVVFQSVPEAHYLPLVGLAVILILIVRQRLKVHAV